MQESFEIEGHSISPGKRKLIKLDIANLPSGTQIDLPIHIVHGRNQGPVLLVTGGLHGDEVNGVEIVRRMMFSGNFNKLKSGTLMAIPLMNIYGFISFSRDLPDGKDVNRSFPGSSKGSLASRVANVISKKVLPLIDFGIDLHTGSQSRYNYPQIRYTAGHQNSRELSEKFNAPLTIANKPPKGSYRSTAIAMGKSIIVFEGGESLRIDEISVREALEGIKRITNDLGLTNLDVQPNETSHFDSTSWIRAPRSGMFLLKKESGNAVSKGDLLGEINQVNSPKGTVKIKASKPGVIIGHNNSPVINQGDALFHLAYNKS